MSIPSKQTGWSEQAKMIYEVIKILDQINKILAEKILP